MGSAVPLSIPFSDELVHTNIGATSRTQRTIRNDSTDISLDRINNNDDWLIIDMNSTNYSELRCGAEVELHKACFPVDEVDEDERISFFSSNEYIFIAV